MCVCVRQTPTCISQVLSVPSLSAVTKYLPQGLTVITIDPRSLLWAVNCPTRRLWMVFQSLTTPEPPQDTKSAPPDGNERYFTIHVYHHRWYTDSLLESTGGSLKIRRFTINKRSRSDHPQIIKGPVSQLEAEVVCSGALAKIMSNSPPTKPFFKQWVLQLQVYNALFSSSQLTRC